MGRRTGNLHIMIRSHTRRIRSGFSVADEKHETLASQCEAVEYEKDRHETKNVLGKRMVYRTLSEVSGKELPWGDLTGIRPTKIPMKMLEEG